MTWRYEEILRGSVQPEGAVAMGLAWRNEYMWPYWQLPWISTELTAERWFSQKGSLSYVPLSCQCVPSEIPWLYVATMIQLYLSSPQTTKLSPLQKWSMCISAYIYMGGRRGSLKNIMPNFSSVSAKYGKKHPYANQLSLCLSKRLF